MSVEFTLRPDQIEDLAALMTNPRHGLWNEPGTGKTPIACLYTWWVWDELKGSTVWIQPLSIIEKNRDEILRFTNFTPDDVVIVGGSPAVRQKLYEKKAKVYLFGADTFGKEWNKIPTPTLLVADEVHMMYSTNDSKRTQALYAAMKKIPRFCPMTGTLIRGRLSSAFPTIHLIENRYYGHYRTFMNHHALLDDWGKVSAWINTEKVTKILQSHGQTRTFRSVYGDVPVVFNPQYVKMIGEQKRAYEEFAEKAILELDSAFLDGSVPGVNLIRSREILSCPEKHGLCKGQVTARDARLEIAAADHLQSGAPWMIGSANKHEQQRLLKWLNEFGIKTELMNGDTKTTERGAMDRRFCLGETQCLIVSPQVGAIGFNWGHCDHVTFCHLDYQYDNFEQFWKRTTRGVRTRPVLVDILIYEDTVEENVLGVLVKKMLLSNQVDASKQIINLHKRSN